jgi:hypothetical protein
MMPVTWKGIILLAVLMLLAIVIGVLLSGHGNCCDVFEG